MVWMQPRPEALKCGISDLGALGAVIRFATLANLTGIPAITIPAGHDTAGVHRLLAVLDRVFASHPLTPKWLEA